MFLDVLLELSSINFVKKKLHVLYTFLAKALQQHINISFILTFIIIIRI